MLPYTNKVIKEKIGASVTLSQIKHQLNIEQDFSEDDEQSATRAAENYIGGDIVLTHNTLELFNHTGQYIKIEEAPFHSIDEILADGTPIVNYEVILKETYFVVKLEESITADKLVIEFYTGKDENNIPKDLLSAILVKTTDLYDIERSSYTTGTNFRSTEAFKNLLNSYKINRW